MRYNKPYNKGQYNPLYNLVTNQDFFIAHISWDLCFHMRFLFGVFFWWSWKNEPQSYWVGESYFAKIAESQGSIFQFLWENSWNRSVPSFSFYRSPQEANTPPKTTDHFDLLMTFSWSIAEVKSQLTRKWTWVWHLNTIFGPLKRKQIGWAEMMIEGMIKLDGNWRRYGDTDGG